MPVFAPWNWKRFLSGGFESSFIVYVRGVSSNLVGPRRGYEGIMGRNCHRERRPKVVDSLISMIIARYRRAISRPFHAMRLCSEHCRGHRLYWPSQTTASPAQIAIVLYQRHNRHRHQPYNCVDTRIPSDRSVSIRVPLTGIVTVSRVKYVKKTTSVHARMSYKSTMFMYTNH